MCSSEGEGTLPEGSSEEEEEEEEEDEEEGGDISKILGEA